MSSVHGSCAEGEFGGGPSRCERTCAPDDCPQACPHIGAVCGECLRWTGTPPPPAGATWLRNSGRKGAVGQYISPQAPTGLIRVGATKGTRSEGVCLSAFATYAGIACELTCPRDLTDPGSGHGLCSATTFDCGGVPQWGCGSACDRCGAHWHRVSCSEPCVYEGTPTDGGGLARTSYARAAGPNWPNPFPPRSCQSGNRLGPASARGQEAAAVGEETASKEDQQKGVLRARLLRLSARSEASASGDCVPMGYEGAVNLILT